MRAPLSWLRDFAPFGDDVLRVADELNALGMVVEAMDRTGEGLESVVVARVLETKPHPDADRVQLVQIDAGDTEPLQIVCGAFNFKAGDLVPLATIGAVLPGGFEIGRRKVRGQWSNGMLCSARELGMGDDAGGIHVLSGEWETGTPLLTALGIEADVVYDLDITANRPDAMSIAGIARDLAARMRLPFTLPEPVIAEAVYRTEGLASVVVESPELCPRFTARVIEGTPIGPSPVFVQKRLTLAGMRPINSVVDASNYVMLELGQPTHPYDLDRLPGAGLLVRAARPGETLVTLDGAERTLGNVPAGSTGDCLICDANGDPVGIGGIMGGASSEISAATTTVLLEAAYFTPMAIAWTSKRLGLRTEASARFERGCDPEGIERAVARFYSLLLGGEVAKGMLDVRAELPADRRVRVRTARVNALLATDLEDTAIAGYLAPIGFDAVVIEPGVLDVKLPSWRPDASIEVDVIEEVARHYGYANIPQALPSSARTGGLTEHQQARRRVRDVLAGLGIEEATNPPLVGPGDHERVGLSEEAMAAANAMLREESILRTSLRPGLLRAVAFNRSHRNPGAWLFEVGKVFGLPDPTAELPDEVERVSVVLDGAGAAEVVHVWRTLVDALRVAGPAVVPDVADGLHPGRTARLEASGSAVGWVGEIDPVILEAHDVAAPVAWLDLDLGALLAAPTLPLQMRPVSRFPSSDIDLAFVVPDSVPAGAVEATLREAAGPLLEWAELFDVYRGTGMPEGARSLAFRLRFQAEDRTLTDAEVAEARRAAIAAVESTHGATLRG